MPSSCMSASWEVVARTTIDEKIGGDHMAVDPTGQDLKHFLGDDPGGPVVMLNLLRFTEDGRAGYEEYAGKIQPFLDELGAQVLYAGDCSSLLVGPEGFEWDTVLLVRYPSRQSF